jgi:hypothetical protein
MVGISGGTTDGMKLQDENGCVVLVRSCIIIFFVHFISAKKPHIVY